MNSIQRIALAERLVPIVRSAGQLALQRRAGGTRPHRKADGSPVTAADLAIQEFIVSAIDHQCLKIPVVSEEAVQSAHKCHTFLLIDPIDGTREYIAGRDEFTINVALVEDGFPTLGLVFAPAYDRLFLCPQPEGAVEIGKDGDRHVLHVRKSAKSDDPVVLASLSHLDPRTDAVALRVSGKPPRRLGSSLKFAMIAAGEAQIYPRLAPTMSWDTAAGQALVEAAGGVVVGLDRQRLRYNLDAGLKHPGFVAAASSALALAALETS